VAVAMKFPKLVDPNIVGSQDPKVLRQRTRDLQDEKKKKNVQNIKDQEISNFLIGLNSKLRTGQFNKLSDGRIHVRKAIHLEHNGKQEFINMIQRYLNEQKLWTVVEVSFHNATKSNTVKSLVKSIFPILPVIHGIHSFVTYLRMDLVLEGH
jgi:hypothetical protein